ncbi:MAG: hypothetical protein RRC34_05915 [Lentisphaeria bacterium]|nr:hypothetical protein [Lentisphaeria bacterium]
MKQHCRYSPLDSRTIIPRPWYFIGLAMTLSVGSLAADDTPREDVPLRIEDRLILTEEDVAGLNQDQLIELMGADLAWSRIAAARALADRGAISVPVFQKALADDDWRVVRAGLDGLTRVLSQAAEAEDDGARKAVAAVVPDIKKTLTNDHYFVRMGALNVLGKLGADAKDTAADVCGLFTDEDFMGVAPTAIKTMAAIGIEHADEKVLMESLGKAIRSADEPVRRAAMGVVAKLEKDTQRKLIPDMIMALQTPMKDGYTRYHLQAKIANLLYDLGEKRALPMSIAILCEKGWGESHRVEQFVPILEKYGPEAISALPLLESFTARFSKYPKTGPMLERAIAKIKGEEQ